VVAEGEPIDIGVEVLHALVQPAHGGQAIAQYTGLLKRQFGGRLLHGLLQLLHGRVAASIQKVA
jgi:hypothetical protein